MDPFNETELLRRYARERSEAAFAALVEQHLGAVYGVALRQAHGDTHLAEDIAQIVFATLARKAATLVDCDVLGGWLYRTTRYAARDVIRTEVRRRKREQEALAMDELSPASSGEVDWEALRMVLDDSMAELKDTERDAVWLRFFENRSFAEIGERLRLTENAARMRVSRALDLLHAALTRRGVQSTTAALTAALTHQPAVAVPAGLSATIAASAVASTGAGGMATAAFVSLLTMSKIKVGVVSVLLLGVAGSIGVELRANRALHAQARAVGGDDLARLHRENRRLTAALENRGEADPAVAEITRLQARAAVLRARPAGVLDAALKPASAHRNAGRGTPEALDETTIWALMARDLDTLASFIVFADDSEAARTAFMAQFSEAVRSRYRTPERLVAAAMFHTDGQTSSVRPDDAFQFLGVDNHVGGDGTRFGQLRVRGWARTADGVEREVSYRIQPTPAGYSQSRLYFANAPRSSDDAGELVMAVIDPATGNLRTPATQTP
jgi:RNA polymerase sigma factor (sigma-70 family)